MQTGVATRQPQQEALAVIKSGAARIVQLSEDQIAAAVRVYFHTTHQVAEGAGAASLAAVMQERKRMSGKRIGIILTGCNIDAEIYGNILAGHTPKVG